jgi:hypothetical protein
MRSGAVFTFTEVSCSIHCIEQNVAVTWHGSVAPLLHCAHLHPKCETAIRKCRSITGRWLRPRSLAYQPPVMSGVVGSDLTPPVGAFPSEL